MKIRRFLVVSMLLAPAYAAAAALAQSAAVPAVKPAPSAADCQLADNPFAADQLPDSGPVMDMAFGPGGTPPGPPPGPGFGPPGGMGPGGPGPGFAPPGEGPRFLARFGPAMMRPGMGPGMMGTSFHPPFPFAGIDLSDDQVEKIANIKAGKRDKSMVVMTKLQPLERQFHQALAQPEINSADVGRLKTDISAQKSVLEQLHTDEIVEIAQVLTPEQRKKIYQSMLRAELGPLGVREHKPHGDGTQK